LLEQSGRCWYRTRDLHFPSLTPQTTHPPLGFPTGARKLQYLSCLASFGILRVAIENRMPWGQAKIKNASQNEEIEEEKRIFLLGKKKKKKFILALGEIRTGDLLHSSPAPYPLDHGTQVGKEGESAIWYTLMWFYCKNLTFLELPKAPKGSQWLLRPFSSSHELPRAPTSSHELPIAPKSSYWLLKAQNVLGF
jgi:hypothetical protein